MKLEDLVAFAKNGWTPKQVKELLEYVETSPAVQAASAPSPEAKPEDVLNINTPAAEIQQPDNNQSEEPQTESPEDIMKRILS